MMITNEDMILLNTPEICLAEDKKDMGQQMGYHSLEWVTTYHSHEQTYLGRNWLMVQSCLTFKLIS